MARPALYIDESLLLEDTVYVAGQRVSPGMYVEVESRKLVHLTREDSLPASCDGRVATYVQRPMNWAGVRDSRPTPNAGGARLIETR